jgi:hypothetical protein
MLNALIELGANINLQDINGDTALIIAVRNGSLDIVYDLIDAGADPNLKNNDGKTALDIAADEDQNQEEVEEEEEEKNEQYNVYTDIINALENYIELLDANTNDSDSDSGESYYYDGMIISEKMSPRRC